MTGRSVPVVHYQNPGSLRTNVVDFSNIASAAGPPHQPECSDLDQPSPCAGSAGSPGRAWADRALRQELPNRRESRGESAMSCCLAVDRCR